MKSNLLKITNDKDYYQLYAWKITPRELINNLANHCRL